MLHLDMDLLELKAVSLCLNKPDLNYITSQMKLFREEMSG